MFRALNGIRVSSVILKRSFYATAYNRKIVPFLLADIGEGTTEVEIVKWHVNTNDTVSQFDKLCEVQSDKAADNITSRYDGIIRKIHYKPGDMAIVGTALVDIEVPDDEQASTDVKVQNPTIPSASVETTSNLAFSDDSGILATPAVRRLAKEFKVDLSKVKPTGKSGRISKEDVISYQSLSEPTGLDNQQILKPNLVPLTGIRKAMFKQMTKSLTIPHFGYTEEIALDELSYSRIRINGLLRTANFGVHRITYMPIFIKALSMALRDFPIMNSKVVVENDDVSLMMRMEHNIGFAMDTDAGLIVPNIKNVQSKSILEIAKELERIRIAGSSQSKADITGGTITLSNIGNIGGLSLHPVLVSSEVCIGAIGRIQKLPRYNDFDELVPQHVLTVNFNADHRVIDGATLARFVQKWKEYLECPSFLLPKMETVFYYSFIKGLIYFKRIIKNQNLEETD